MNITDKIIDRILIAGITPYFLEKGNFWFEQNMEKILQARKTQPFFVKNTLYLQRSQSLNFSQLLRKLDELGYEKVFQISEPGEFSQRGGIIDVFPINANYPYRLEFFGNKIENIELLPIKLRNEKTAKEILKNKLKSQKLFSNLGDLKSGDYLVHLDHGISRFCGIGNFQFPNSPPARAGNIQNEKIQTERYYILEYDKGDKLYVPVGLERKLSRYVGFVEPKISRLGSSLWQKTKRKVKEEAEKLAKELLELYAKKEIVKRDFYSPDNDLEHHLVSTFLYKETPDQIQAIKDIKNDFKKEKPMDRIVCGDVGFGKTEVALRAAVLAANSSRQVAMIAPTTILANQHFNNFKNRLEKLPLKVALLTRLQSKREQKKIIEDLKQGLIDILIGTHRVINADVEFKNLQLLIVDDEQKFGVKQKEKLRKTRANLDVLSLSATPIPRTLYLALSSFKDISLIQTPPAGRQAVQTSVLPYEEKLIKKAIEFEIKRGGQIYFLHNRVQTIEKVKEKLENLTPRAKIGIIHGRLKEKELVATMNDFQKEKINLLIATTIIENGLDFAKVNTLIVEDATRLGLSQAYQLRGRVGRSHIQSFAYFFYPPKFRKTNPAYQKAMERLNALKEAEALGSGYQIALKDLEIRGAGNILGKEQSGNINKVGLNLYCQILAETVDKLKNS